MSPAPCCSIKTCRLSARVLQPLHLPDAFSLIPEFSYFLSHLVSYPNRADSLAIIKHRTSFAGQTGPLHITTFDPQGAFVNILVHAPQPDGSVKEEMIKLDIEPAIQSPFEARGRMYHWRDMAFRKFGVVSATATATGETSLLSVGWCGR